MQRQIKFRAWDDHNEIMIDPYCELKDGKFWGEDCTNTGISVKHEHVMMFTGLLDKNGKEVFEGDILKDTEEPAHFKVVWVDERTGFDFYRIEDGDYMSNFYDNKDLVLTSIVIGNIHENPNLLK